MRKFLSGMAALIACAAMFCACSDDATDDNGNSEDKSDKMAKFESFGFYAEDNDALDTDYVADVAPEMIVRLPADVDKTALVARFTTTENDVVTVGAKVQVSGETANDFSYPLDYVVKDQAAKITTSYTVKVGKILSKVWTRVASYNEVVDGTTLINDDYGMALCPKTKTPYFLLSRTNSAGVDAGVVVKMGANGMTATPEISFDVDGTTPVDCNNPDIAVDADGKVYAMYYYHNGASTETKALPKMFVKTGGGATWSLVGSTFGNTTCGSWYSIDVDPATKRPVVGYFANSASGSVARRDLNLCYFDGSAWSSENLLTDVAAKYIYGQTLRVMNGSLYLGGLVQTAPGTYFVYKYKNGGWEKIINALPAGVSQTNMAGFSFAVASDGTAYCCAGGDEDATGTWKVTVYKAAPGAANWTRVSTPLNVIVERNSRFVMNLYNDLPLVFYKDPTSSLPTVVSLNPDTKQWDAPLVMGTTAVGMKMLQCEFDADGVGYAAFLDDGDNKALTVYKFDTEADDLQE